jgi:L-ascorbate metabolism protein UlaG (beta-lactamase superfamily)
MADLTATLVGGPGGTDHITGPVIGFFLTGAGVPTVYVSGDNASVDMVRVIVARLGPPELAVLFVGGTSIPARFEGAYLTLSSERAVEAAQVLGSRKIVPVHFDGWAHFSDDGASLRAAFAAGGFDDRLAFAEPGETVTL